MSYLRNSAAVWVPTVIALATLLVVWEVAVWGFGIESWLLAPPSAVFGELYDSPGLLVGHAGTTLTEIILGFAISISIGVVLATGIVWSRVIERSVFPIIIASQTIPIFALAPLLIIWIGTDIMSKVVVVVLFTFFPVVISLVTGLRSVDSEMVDMLRTLGATPYQTFSKLMVPTALPNFFAGMKVAAVISVIGAVIGEWVGASAGLGWLMKVTPQYQTARIFAAIVVLSVLAMGLFAAVVLWEKWALRKYPATANQVTGLGEP